MNFLNQNHSSEYFGKSKQHTVCTTYFMTEKFRKYEYFIYTFIIASMISQKIKLAWLKNTCSSKVSTRCLLNTMLWSVTFVILGQILTLTLLTFCHIHLTLTSWLYFTFSMSRASWWAGGYTLSSDNIRQACAGKIQIMCQYYTVLRLLKVWTLHMYPALSKAYTINILTWIWVVFFLNLKAPYYKNIVFETFESMLVL